MRGRLSVTRRLAALATLGALSLFVPAGGAAQHGSAERSWLRAGGLAVLSGTSLDPAPGGGRSSEIRLEQPILFARAGASPGRFQVRAHGMLNFEGFTIPGGVLTMGTFGEGFVDRRHPHTWLHELMVSVEAAGLSVAGGKGFAAFGTDDPMDRPPLRYPVNHHWAQIMERAVVTVGARRGPVVLEGSLFNGDEPESPWQWPRFRRFGDSWSTRIVLRPVGGVEIQGSRARVASPEHRPGAGPDVVRWSTSARYQRDAIYALAEWARTTEADGFFTFGSVLGEAAWRVGRHRPFYRLERTERPEEERTLDAFRSQRPHLDDSILGSTRWTIQTVGWQSTLPGPRGVRLEPLAEVSFGRVAKIGDGIFDPEFFYGGGSLRTVTIGIRMAAGQVHRMGRYGVLSQDERGMVHDHR